MRIAVIGAGNVGGGLGSALAAAGHSVVFGVRDPASPKTTAALSAISGATATTPAEARSTALMSSRSPFAGMRFRRSWRRCRR